MAEKDKLTQLQNSLDLLAAQMYMSLNYVSTRTALAQIPGQPYHGTPAEDPTSTSFSGNTVVSSPRAMSPAGPQSQDTQAQQAHQQQMEDGIPRPDSPATFAAALRELSRDLVSREQQIEGLIRSLPGLGVTREQQEVRLRELDQEVKDVQMELETAARDKDMLVERVESAIMQCKRW